MIGTRDHENWRGETESEKGEGSRVVLVLPIWVSWGVSNDSYSRTLDVGGNSDVGFSISSTSGPGLGSSQDEGRRRWEWYRHRGGSRD